MNDSRGGALDPFVESQVDERSDDEFDQLGPIMRKAAAEDAEDDVVEVLGGKLRRDRLDSPRQ